MAFSLLTRQTRAAGDLALNKNRYAPSM